jgi:hypothetical protein
MQVTYHEVWKLGLLDKRSWSSQVLRLATFTISKGSSRSWVNNFFVQAVRSRDPVSPRTNDQTADRDHSVGEFGNYFLTERNRRLSKKPNPTQKRKIDKCRSGSPAEVVINRLAREESGAFCNLVVPRWTGGTFRVNLPEPPAIVSNRTIWWHTPIHKHEH